MKRIDDVKILGDLRKEHTRELAFRTLYENFFVSIKLLAAKMTGDNIVAQDILQDVFRDFWDQKPFLHQEIRSFSALLFEMCRHRCLNYQRDKSKRSSFHQDIGYTSQVSAQPQAGEDVKRQIARLPKKQQIAVELVVIDEHTYAEAAAIMGISVSTVQTHIDRAKKSLASIYVRRF